MHRSDSWPREPSVGPVHAAVALKSVKTGLREAREAVPEPPEPERRLCASWRDTAASTSAWWPREAKPPKNRALGEGVRARRPRLRRARPREIIVLASTRAGVAPTSI